MIDYTSREDLPDTEIPRMLAYIKKIIAEDGHAYINQNSNSDDLNDFNLALHQLRKLATAGRATPKMFYKAGYSVSEIIEVMSLINRKTA